MPNTSSGVFGSPAAILHRAGTAELLAVAKRSGAMDPAIFDERPPFFFAAEISSTRLDAYYTRMHPTTLKNFAAEAEAGVTFQNSHRTLLGIGYSLGGAFIRGGEGVSRVEADFYTVPGIKLSDLDTDNFILGVRAGLVRDVSVGFYGGIFRCSICQRDMMRDWDCYHVPGFTYAQSDEDGRVLSESQAFAWIEDAHLAEVSAVYDGATPGAAIIKAEQEAERGRMPEVQIRTIEQRYRIHLPTPGRIIVPGIDIPHKDGAMTLPVTERTSDQAAVTTDVVDEVQPAETDATPPVDTPAQDQADTESPAVVATVVLDAEALEPLRAQIATLSTDLTTLTTAHAEADATLRQVRELVATVDAPAETSVVDRVRLLADAWRAAVAANAQLEAQAADGRQYREDLIVTALAEGVRAHGTSYDADMYRGILANLPLAAIRQMRDGWQTLADKALAGGRKTVDTVSADEQPAESTTPAVPTAAYKGA